MPLLAQSASDVTATVKASAQVNAAVGGASSRGGNSAPPPAGGAAAGRAVVTQSAVAKSGSSTFSLLRTVNFIPRGPLSWAWPSVRRLDLFYPSVILASSDGRRIFVSRDGQGTYRLTLDGGLTWTTGASYISSNVGEISGGAMSSSGSKIALINVYGTVGISNDGGLTWVSASPGTAISGTNAFRGITMSDDGTRIAIATGQAGGYVFTSSNGGISWTQRTSAGARDWGFITGSSDGMTLLAFVGGTTIYRSTDGGDTWALWYTGIFGFAAASADCSILLSYSGNKLYRSINGGLNWTVVINPLTVWRGVSISADGTKMVATTNGALVLSEDTGLTWKTQVGPTGDIRSVRITRDGTRIIVGEYGNSRVHFGEFS